MEQEKPLENHDKDLPATVNFVDFIAGRIHEFKKLRNDIKSVKAEKLLHQKLPNHMRRRAMSHNPARLPRKYRRMHVNQMNKSGPSAKKKRPSRKYRRKQSNLMKEYIRRQRDHVWMETHIWHAKRFHMANLWGYKIPYSPCDKRYRASYKAISRHCLINDLSFYGCLEVSGPLETLRQSFSRLASPECGLTITAKPFLSGCREGIVDLFKIDCYPLGGIGKVRVLWKPEDPESPDIRTVWFFVHPSVYRVVVEELIVLFDLVNSNHKNEESMESQEDFNNREGQRIRRNKDKMEVEDQKNQEDQKVLKTGKIVEKMEVQEISENQEDQKNLEVENKVELDGAQGKMEGLEDSKQSSKFKKYQKKKELQLRFITRNSSFLRCPTYNNEKLGITMTELKDTMNRFRVSGPLANATILKALKFSENSKDTWLEKWLENERNQEANRSQSEFYEKFSGSPSEFPPHMVLALNILDPRINRPVTRTKAEIRENLNSFIEIPDFSNISAIWDRKSRDQLLDNLMTSQRLCELRNEKGLVPGEMCSFEASLQPLPVLLINNPGNPTIGCGWDLIVPAGYGMSVWLSLIYCGAKCGGWQEIEMTEDEKGQDLFIPDTITYEWENKRVELANREKYFKRPPNKRQNYRKLGISSPFSGPFQQLVQEWSGSKEFQVLRNRGMLANLQKSLKGKFPLNSLQIPENSLIPISLKINRGNPGKNAIICLPNKKDLKNFHLNKYQREKTPILTEPLHNDENEGKRKSLRVNHKKLLKRMRNRRVRLKRKLQKTSKYHVKIPKSVNEKIVEEQYQKMCELWVPSVPKTVRNQCSRETIGYLTNSRFKFSESTVCGIGYITANSFLQLVNFFKKYKSKEIFVLVRANNSRHYLTARFNVREEI